MTQSATRTERVGNSGLTLATPTVTSDEFYERPWTAAQSSGKSAERKNPATGLGLVLFGTLLGSLAFAATLFVGGGILFAILIYSGVGVAATLTLAMLRLLLDDE